MKYLFVILFFKLSTFAQVKNDSIFVDKNKTKCLPYTICALQWYLF